MSEYFEFRKVELDDPLIEEVYRLRYKVYCDECHFEKPEDHPGGVEIDEFDQNSVHFVAIHRGDRQMIGTVRLILNSERGFPIEKHCTIDADLSAINRSTLGEISRLAISKEYRRRVADQFLYRSEESGELETDWVANERRKSDNAIVVGLYRCIFLESLQRPVTHLYVAMARGLYHLLKRIGITFTPAGPEIDYHGLRAPYLTSSEKISNDLAHTNPELFQLFHGPGGHPLPGGTSL